MTHQLDSMPLRVAVASHRVAGDLVSRWESVGCRFPGLAGGQGRRSQADRRPGDRLCDLLERKPRTGVLGGCGLLAITTELTNTCC
jgi:hypothetical protein